MDLTRIVWDLRLERERIEQCIRSVERSGQCSSGAESAAPKVIEIGRTGLPKTVTISERDTARAILLRQRFDRLRTKSAKLAARRVVEIWKARGAPRQ